MQHAASLAFQKTLQRVLQQQQQQQQQQAADAGVAEGQGRGGKPLKDFFGELLLEC